MTVPVPEPAPLWYGESYQLDSGPSPWRYHFDGTSAPLEAGADVIVGAYAESNFPDAFAAYAEPIEARWVIEVEGGIGTFDLWAGVDPSWAYADPSLATQYLGTFTANGAGRIVSPPLDVIDHAGLVAQSAPVIARLTGATGSVEIAQVKLRVWPAAGAGGAWESGLNWVRIDEQVQRWYATLEEATPQVPTYEWAWNSERELIKGWNGRSGVEYRPDTGGGPSIQSFFYDTDTATSPPFTPFAWSSATIAIVMAQPGGPSPDPSLNAGVDPNEVAWEEQSRIRAIGGGPASAVFDRWTDDATVTVENTMLAGKGLPSAPTLTPHPTRPQLRIGQFQHPTAWDLRDGAVPLWQFGGQYVALSVMASAYFPPAPTEDAVTSATGMLASELPFWTRIANYEWFNPGAPATPPVVQRKPRFFVTFTEVDNDPREVSHIVGIGKPADDASIFKVPTAMGTLRELRHGEKVSDVSVAYPLKVKLEDGSWTVVAGMTPDD